MRKSILLSVLLTLALALSVNAQDFRNLEKLTKDLKTQAADIVAKTNKVIEKEGLHSASEIRNAFLARQFQTSTSLIERFIHSRYHMSEIRYAGMVLSDLSQEFPVAGQNAFEWKKAKDTIYELSRELRGLNSGVQIENAAFQENLGGIIGKAIWTGMVDKDVVLSIKGDRISSTAISGTRYPEGTYSFSSVLPKEKRIRVGVKIKRGRGKVHVMQQPNEENEYTTIVQVRDDEGGAKQYVLEVFWYRR